MDLVFLSHSCTPDTCHHSGQLLKEPVRLYFFYSEESGGLKVQEGFIAPLSKNYPLEIQSFSLNKLENYDLLGKFEKELKQEKTTFLSSSSGIKSWGRGQDSKRSGGID